jgi:biopolymer transport protein ExbD
MSQNDYENGSSGSQAGLWLGIMAAGLLLLLLAGGIGGILYFRQSAQEAQVREELAAQMKATVTRAAEEAARQEAEAQIAAQRAADEAHELPQASAVEPRTEVRMHLVINIDRAGTISVADRELTVAELEQHVVQELASTPKLSAVLHVDTETTMKQVVAVLDLLRRVEVHDIQMTLAE